MDYILLENVARLKLKGLHEVVSDLEVCGFCDIRWITLKACQVGAPHKRDRLFAIATRQGVPNLEIKDNYCSKSHWPEHTTLFDICPLVVRNIAKVSSEHELLNINTRKLQRFTPQEKTDRAHLQLLGNSIVPQLLAYSLLSHNASTLNLQETTDIQQANLSLHNKLYTFTIPLPATTYL